ncbi:PP2C family protein-serine/threonine phosphatase [Streptomyces sp. PBH53]|uniref:PP2C family protein-serine/threonine phosphatase n=1 Tax=Streptomyces sp. PBH53 TaxID=1577075 RepID=UPI000AA0750B|nr:PP2C family protein-serine/threonine phosphatase [Streptomyces sp. PBH53]
MVRWIRSRRRPRPVAAGRRPDGGCPGEAEQAARAAVPLSALRETLAGIGTTLDADTTCAELTRAAVRLAGGAAAVLRRTGDTAPGYEAITGDAETLLVVGDVMGHGLESAVDMNAYRSSLRYIASADLPPHRVLRQMDDIASGEADRRPATCLLARVDPGRGQVTLASAGHLPPALIDRDGVTGLLSVPVGPPLGTGLGGYESATHRLAPGETLVLFTDGLVERRGEDIDRSLDRLAALGFAAGDAVDSVLETILGRLDARHAEDDVAVLAARPHIRQGAAAPGETGGPATG